MVIAERLFLHFEKGTTTACISEMWEYYDVNGLIYQTEKQNSE